MDVDLNSQALQQKLESLKHERQQVREQLAARGRGPGMGGRSFGPPGGRGGGPGGPGDRFGGERPAFGGRPGVTPFGRDAMGRQGSRGGAYGRPGGLPGRAGSFEGGAPRSGSGSMGGASGEAPAPSRKRVLSAVMVDGEVRTAAADEAEEPMEAEPTNGGYHARDEDHAGPVDDYEPPPKRPARELSAPERKRSSRLLGGLLLGTLQKFRDDDAKFKVSRVAQQRQELDRRVDEKLAEEAVQLRQAAREEAQARKAQSFGKLRTINLQSELLNLELKAAKAIERRQLLAAFLVTAPTLVTAEGAELGAVLWAPKEHSEATRKLAAARAAEFEAWRAEALQQLEADKAAAQGRSEQRAAEAEARFAEREAARRQRLERIARGEAAGPEVPDEEAEGAADQEEEGAEGAAGMGDDGEQPGEEEEAAAGGHPADGEEGGGCGGSPSDRYGAGGEAGGQQGQQQRQGGDEEEMEADYEDDELGVT